jgi:hypothetical protein
LENVVDQYLAAVIAHNPKLVPLSADVKYTENDQRLEVGDGIWKTAQGRGKYTHIFADPEGGQVAYMGTLMEAGAPLLMSLRLRIELGRITRFDPTGCTAQIAGEVRNFDPARMLPAPVMFLTTIAGLPGMWRPIWRAMARE